MKKYFFTFLFAGLTALGGFPADRIDNIVATVELIRREPITKASVDARYDEIKKAMNATDAPGDITKKEVLEQLIDVALLVQGADRDGIRVSDSSYNNFKKQKLAELSTLLKRVWQDVNNSFFWLKYLLASVFCRMKLFGYNKLPNFFQVFIKIRFKNLNFFSVRFSLSR